MSSINILLPEKNFSKEENRMLANFPEINRATYLDGRFESGTENYVNDQFMFRNGFIKIKSAFDKTRGINKSNGVLIGKRGFFFEERVPLSNKREADTIRALKEFKKRYSNKKTYFLLAPNSFNILKDNLPLFSVDQDQNKDMNKFFGDIKGINIKPIDVREDFKKYKNKEELYYRTDHHWTSTGAMTAYKRLANVMNLSCPEYKPYVVKTDFLGTLTSRSGFSPKKCDNIVTFLPKENKCANYLIFDGETKEKTNKYYNIKNLKKKDAYTYFGGENKPLYTIESPVQNGKTLLLIKDSYANSIIPFLADKFSKILVIDPRYYFDNIDDLIEAEGVEEILFLYNANTLFSDDSLAMSIEDVVK